jgi:glycosyltransferase involved in cell wall biosynthesis
MKIAMMARGFQPTPHPADMTNAPSDIAMAVAEGLTGQGHDVTFFGPTTTRLKRTKVQTSRLPPLVQKLDDLKDILSLEAKSSHNLLGLWDQYLAHEMFQRASAGEFDVLHFHHPEAALPYARHYPNVPVVYTVHDPIDHWFGEAMRMYGSPNQFYISISDNQRTTAPDLPYIATVHNGIDTSLFAYHDTPDDYLLFAGRIMADKGVHQAIAVAEATNSRLLIIGAVYGSHREYFKTQIQPHLNERIQYLGFMEREAVVPYYQNARALLFPTQWEEPFGLTMIEAMSCGTPVIAAPRGAVPEVVVDGETGFIASSVADMAAAVAKIDLIQRSDCRAHVERAFSNEIMVKDYAAAYAKAIRRAHAKPKRGATDDAVSARKAAGSVGRSVRSNVSR